MAKRDKYHPDYQKLYPGVDLDAEVMRVLMQSDRKMRYLEVDIKRGKYLQDSAVFVSTREDSLDRLQDEERMVFKRKPSFMFMLYLFILYLILISSSFPSATDTTASFPGRTSLLIGCLRELVTTQRTASGMQRRKDRLLLVSSA